MQPDAGAAFTIEIEGQNLLVIAQEVKRHARHMPDMDSLIKAIRQAVVAEYQLTVHRVVLLKPGGIPKTTSGKIQRSRCRELLIAEDLPVIRQYVLAYPVTTPLSPSGPAFSLLYFSSHEAEFSEDKYRLLIDGAKFADQHDFEAVWLPERYFHAFGGLYPNPSTLAAALAMVTQRVRLRAGSVVMPLHDPIRVAEEWAVADNLSGGRVDLSFARGWNPNDFVLAPDQYADNTAAMRRGLETVQQLWQGQPLIRQNGLGHATKVKIYPLPQQPELAIWLTCTQVAERFREAGALGHNVLTALLFQSIEELAKKIAIYRQARAEHGYDPATGRVTCMIHTLVGTDLDRVKHQVREPFIAYLRSSVDLWRQDSQPLDSLSATEQEILLDYAFERYFQSSALFGTPESCLPMVRLLRLAGVDEVACLIDFGVDVDTTLKSLVELNQLKQLAAQAQASTPPAIAVKRSSGPRRLPSPAVSPIPEPKTHHPSHLAQYLQSQVAQTLQIRLDQVDLREPLSLMGFDSLMPARFLGQVWDDLGIELPVEYLFEGMSIADLLDQINDPFSSDCGPSSIALPVNRPPLSHNDEPGALTTWPLETYRFDHFPEYLNLEHMLAEVSSNNPYFQVRSGCSNAHISRSDQRVINFSSYNYLGLSGDPRVSQATQDAIEQYGTSVSASRLISGEIPLHRALEEELADFIGAEDCLVYIGGHATNVTTIGHLLGPKDLILHDALIHNSVIQGVVMSGATSQTFPHNDWVALEAILKKQRPRYRRVLIVIEGVYSMDGDIPNLPPLIEIKRRYGALLMIDEAHSIGTIGQSGRGIGEYWRIDPTAVDIWMGTLSKSLASCGGYIAGSRALIKYLKYTAPGFVYSVGISPPNTASALAALRLLKAEPERVGCLQERAKLFLSQARVHHLNTGPSDDSPIVPVIIGVSDRCLQLSQYLLERSISVFPIIFPAVSHDAARLRFFITCNHTESQIHFTVDTLAQILKRLA